MDKDDFYITLPSDSSMKIFTENKTTCFTAQLPRHLNLVGDWSIALTEIQYPQTFLHIPDEILETKFKYSHNGTKYSIQIPSGLYTNISDIIDFLNKSKFKKHFIIELDSAGFVKISLSCCGESNSKCSINSKVPHSIEIDCFSNVPGKVLTSHYK